MTRVSILSAIVLSAGPLFAEPAAVPPEAAAPAAPAKPPEAAPAKAEQPVIEVVFALDTTGSMGGLIEGAKQKIWAIVNEIATGKPTPIVRVGFVPYRDFGDAYVTQVHPLTDDLDKAFEALKGFRADGGGDEPEHVNKGLADAVHAIPWSKGDKVYKVIFLVGDCPPHTDYKDGLDYRKTCEEAAKAGIMINTVRCGGHARTEAIWQEIARAADGDYLSIDQKGGMVAVTTPFDKELGELAAAVTDTTVAQRGREKSKESDDAATLGYREAAAKAPAPAVGAVRSGDLAETTPSAEAEARMALSAGAGKAGYYAHSGQAFGSWDLVQGVIDGRVHLDEMKEEDLPEEMKKMSKEEREKFVAEKIARRKEVQARIAELSKKRDEYIKEETRKLAGEKDSFDAAVLKTVKKQAEKIGVAY